MNIRPRCAWLAARPPKGLVVTLAAMVALTAVAAAPGATDTTSARAGALFQKANQFWAGELREGKAYIPAQLVLFHGQIRAVCGAAGSLTGPFYCPSDLKVYLDSQFLHQVARRTSGPLEDYALGYVIGHELGQHIQNLVGTTSLVEQARADSVASLSARTWMTQELQADCFAGLWMRSALMRQQIRPAADPSAALEAVSSVSQARLARPASGETMVDPLLTYATPALRLKWFQRGLDSGHFNDCNTFGAEAAGRL